MGIHNEMADLRNLRKVIPSLERQIPSSVALYHKNVIDHYENPRNVGSMDKKDKNVGTGLVGAPACGDVMKLQVKVDDDGNIIDAKFKTFGCVSATCQATLLYAGRGRYQGGTAGLEGEEPEVRRLIWIHTVLPDSTLCDIITMVADSRNWPSQGLNLIIFGTREKLRVPLFSTRKILQIKNLNVGHC